MQTCDRFLTIWYVQKGYGIPKVFCIFSVHSKMRLGNTFFICVKRFDTSLNKTFKISNGVSENINIHCFSTVEHTLTGTALFLGYAQTHLDAKESKQVYLRDVLARVTGLTYALRKTTLCLEGSISDYDVLFVAEQTKRSWVLP